MSGLVFHPSRWRWLLTLIALSILLLAGGVVGFIISSSPLSIDQLDKRFWLGWRLVFYALLIGLWPLLFQGLLKKHSIAKAHKLKRLPIVVLIVLYELLIVQNPLQTLLRLWSE